MAIQSLEALGDASTNNLPGCLKASITEANSMIDSFVEDELKAPVAVDTQHTLVQWFIARAL